MMGAIGDAINTVLIVAIVGLICLPLAVWKLFDIAIWFLSHVRWVQ